MRIVLLSSSYPPESHEGIARQRQALASACVQCGYEVHVITLSQDPDATRTNEHGVHVERVCPPATLTAHHGVQLQKLQSVMLAHRVMQLHQTLPIDVIDAPIWSAPGWACIHKVPVPLVLNLQTTSAQLAEINGRQSDDSAHVIEMERYSALQADGILADSETIRTATLDTYGLNPSALTRCIYHGLPDAPGCPNKPTLHKEAEILLVVGRLEKRKGTPEILAALPSVLKASPNLMVHFAGGDNSAHDGWLAETGLDYATYFQRSHPELATRVTFEGYVSEDRLHQLRAIADIIAVPSRYESFGFTYVEAMRQGVPAVVFGNDAVSELFPAAEQHGACVIPLHETSRFARALIKLAHDPTLRQRIGQAGRARYLECFRDINMAERSAAFYQEVIYHRAERSRPPAAKQETGALKIQQLVEAISTGDGVSQIAHDIDRLLIETGRGMPMLCQHKDPACETTVAPYCSALDDTPRGLLFHYWNYNHSLWLLDRIPGPKALYYHNITPPDFFLPGSEQEWQTRRAHQQLRTILNRFQWVIGDSNYNTASLIPHLTNDCKRFAIYPIVDPVALKAAPYDAELLNHLLAFRASHWLFVGRVARNKDQGLLMQWFDAYCQATKEQAHLWMVGNDTQDPVYRSELERLRRLLPHGQRMHFTGKVSSSELSSYYRAANLFVSASGHEGFCIPIAHAMAFDIPVAAKAAAAVPETMGNSGYLLQQDDPQTLVPCFEQLIRNETMRASILKDQRINLRRFSREKAGTTLNAVIEDMSQMAPP